MEELEGTVVPFGKYRGHPVDAALADMDYCQWLRAQPWVEQRFPAFYAAILTNGASLVLSSPGTSDGQVSPEHNEMQARFLEPGWRLALARQLWGDYGFARAASGLEHWLGCGRTPRPPDDEAFPGSGLSFGQARLLARLTGQEEPQCRRCQSYGRKKYPGPPADLSTRPPSSSEPKFEDNGWDVTYAYAPWTITWNCACGKEEAPGNSHCASHDWQAGNCDDCTRAEDAWEHHQKWHGGDRFEDPSEDFSAESVKLGIEIKPDLGDDYPTVLRQVQRYIDNDRRRSQYRGDYVPEVHLVVARRAQFRGVTWEQVAAIFHRSNVHLVKESSLYQARG